MLKLLTYMPIMGSAIGIAITLFVLISKSVHQNVSRARYYLAAAIFLTTINLFEGIYTRTWEQFAWASYFLYQFIGFAYLLYARSLLDLNINIKKWSLVLAVITVIHTIINIVLKEEVMNLTDYDDLEIRTSILLIVFDYYVCFIFNVYSVYRVYREVKNISSDRVKADKHLNLIWVKKVFGTVTFIYLLSVLLVVSFTVIEILFNKAALALEMNEFTRAIYNVIQGSYVFEKTEAILTSLFIFTIAIWSMRIPVFSNYQPMVEEPKEVKKYAKSTLKEDQSEEIWNQIIHLMEEEKMYQNPTLRLNDLVNEIGKPLPHISQVINERMNMSFLDFVNQYRVEEAKKLLCDEKSQALTILAIAYEVGFNSKTTFYTSFKKVTGQTPSEFKKSN